MQASGSSSTAVAATRSLLLLLLLSASLVEIACKVDTPSRSAQHMKDDPYESESTFKVDPDFISALEIKTQIKATAKLAPVIGIAIASAACHLVTIALNIGTQIWAHVETKKIVKLSKKIREKVEEKVASFSTFSENLGRGLDLQWTKAKELGEFLKANRYDELTHLPETFQFLVANARAETDTSFAAKVGGNAATPKKAVTLEPATISRLGEDLKAIITRNTATYFDVNWPRVHQELFNLIKSSGDEAYHILNEVENGIPAAPDFYADLIHHNAAMVALFPYLTSLASLTQSAIMLGVEVLNTKTFVTACLNVKDMYKTEGELLLQDIDYEFCRLYSDVYDRVRAQADSISSWKRTIDPDHLAEQELFRNSELHAKADAYVKATEDIVKLVEDAMRPCDKFYQLTKLGNPIREIWGSNFLEKDSPPADTTIRTFVIKFRPSFVMNKKTKSFNYIAIYRPEAGAVEETSDDPVVFTRSFVGKLSTKLAAGEIRDVAAAATGILTGTADISTMVTPSMIDEKTDLAWVPYKWLYGDKLWSPVTHIMQRFLNGEKFRLGPMHLDLLRTDMTCTGLFQCSEFDPVLIGRDYNRKRDAFREQSAWCSRFHDINKRTVSQHARCLRTDTNSDFYAQNVFKETGVREWHPEWLNFAARARYRWFAKPFVPDHEIPQHQLLLYYERKPGAPIVDIVQGKPNAEWKRQGWKRIPLLLDGFSESCLKLKEFYDTQELDAYYIKDYSLTPPRLYKKPFKAVPSKDEVKAAEDQIMAQEPPTVAPGAPAVVTVPQGQTHNFDPLVLSEGAGEEEQLTDLFRPADPAAAVEGPAGGAGREGEKEGGEPTLKDETPRPASPIDRSPGKGAAGIRPGTTRAQRRALQPGAKH